MGSGSALKVTVGVASAVPASASIATHRAATTAGALRIGRLCHGPESASSRRGRGPAAATVRHLPGRSRMIGRGTDMPTRPRAIHALLMLATGGLALAIALLAGTGAAPAG